MKFAIKTCESHVISNYQRFLLVLVLVVVLVLIPSKERGQALMFLAVLSNSTFMNSGLGRNAQLPV